jgi:hypothetical protein
MVIGMLRIAVKPVMTVLINLANETETKKDDKIVHDIEQSKIYKALIFILDYMASIKIPPRNKK